MRQYEYVDEHHSLCNYDSAACLFQIIDSYDDKDERIEK